nr:glucose dehydrogenase [Corynebacterium lactis]
MSSACYRPSATSIRRAALATASAGTLALGACFSPSAAPEASFTEVSAQPSGVKMPKFSSPDLPSTPVPTTAAKPREQGRCATDATTIAACLPGTTALTTLGPGEALVATDDGALTVVAPGKPPREVTRIGSPAKQLLASPSVTEDRQVYVLRQDSTVARVTILEGAPADVRELDALKEPGILGIYFKPNRTGHMISKLLVGDPGIEFQQFCHGPENMPALATAVLDGVPQLVQFSGGLIEPLGGVDLDNSIGGCAVAADRVIIAIPGANKVISVPIGAEHAGLNATWHIKGAPETLVEGEFGQISHVASVPAKDGFEVWGATTNKKSGGTVSESDERVVRLPNNGAAGGSPD